MKRTHDIASVESSRVDLSFESSHKSLSPAKKLRKSQKQGTLSFQSNINETKTCKLCGMSYLKYLKQDQQLHEEYHTNFVDGLSWQFSGNYLKSITVVVKKQRHKINFVAIDTDSTPQIRRVDDVLHMVNQELNASSGSDSWKKTPGQAVLAITNRRVIGIVVTETIDDVEGQSRWMIHKTQAIVPKQINKNAKLGISRIWVAYNWRRLGISTALLTTITTYPKPIHRREIAFSQPSTNGGLLCAKFNGVKHKSGEILLPVYLEHT
ncbi:N-acetyltransferase Eco1p [[Candida] jaroonii]|uniref:N-acetyltransferase Eco1p n=1 Tax=[Candida] jaroonii TaxID=467808 RepID=A0ACA9Y8S7_9ASCO|nr:N-acetyltransferase Eco1p [[Candida] jaroonii]